MDIECDTGYKDITFFYKLAGLTDLLLRIVNKNGKM